MSSTVETLAEALRAKLGLKLKEQWDVGEKHLHFTGSPPRVVLVPRGGRVVEPRVRFDADYQLNGTKYRAKHIHDDLLRIEAHCWEASYESLERLRNRMLSASREVFGSACEAGEYEITTERDRSGHMVHGAACVQVFAWRLRVCQFTARMRTEAGPFVPVRALVTILNQTHDCQLLDASDAMPAQP